MAKTLIQKITGAVDRPVEVWPDGEANEDCIAQEVAVALVYNGISHAVMMASPLNLDVFAKGFSLTEGIIDQPGDIFSIDINHVDGGIEVSIAISGQCFMRLKNKRRNLSGRTGCGICGAESIQQIRTNLPKVSGDFLISHKAINCATLALNVNQPLQHATGAVHGAAWCDTQGTIVQVCEDVGRHNALDKLIGLLWQQGSFSQPGFLLISSRASYEIVQKAAMANIAVVAAVSAPTSLAIDIAEETGITLVGFSRKNRHVAYTNTHRLKKG